MNPEMCLSLYCDHYLSAIFHSSLLWRVMPRHIVIMDCFEIHLVIQTGCLINNFFRFLVGNSLCNKELAPEENKMLHAILRS